MTPRMSPRPMGCTAPDRRLVRFGEFQNVGQNVADWDVQAAKKQSDWLFGRGGGPNTRRLVAFT